jgi:transposase InsO family protein/transposase-like protein
MRAVKLYIQYDFSLASVIHELGYPNNPKSLKSWYIEFRDNGFLHEERSFDYHKYTPEQKRIAIEHFIQHGKCVSRTVRALGYPSRPLLYEWIKEECPDLLGGCKRRNSLVYLSQEEKEQAVIDLCSRTGPARIVAEKYGTSKESLYYWKNKLLPKEYSPAMAKKQEPLTREEAESQIAELKAEVAQLTQQAEDLKRQVHQLDLEKCILEKAAEVLKKGQGISIPTLTNREKAIVINALRKQFRLKELLKSIQMAKSSYCYQVLAMNTDRYKELRDTIHSAFDEANGRYGYRRIRAVITSDGSTVSEKVVRRIMKEEGLNVRSIKRKKYNSYKGEISPEVPNILQRNFHADKPNEKWLTDITEFHIPAGKIYLSPIIDCFDGLPVSWTIGTSPDAELVNAMLDEALLTLSDDEKPIIHSDRGCHYRWPGWIERMESAGLTRSMSKKGCSPDNSACEGFFGRLKNEMFYGISWLGVSISDFIAELDRYIQWYAEKRIKLSLGGMSPLDYRRSLGLIAPR